MEETSATRAPGTRLVVAEKPSVARDIARALGVSGRGNGYLHGSGFVITWAIGHLVELPQPHQIDPAWKRWNLQALPIFPRRWPLQVVRNTAAQFKVVSALLRDGRIRQVVCATDAGREGELIFRFIYERARCTKPVQRLWISAMTADAIRAGFARLRPGSDYDALAAAARGRAHADWLVGMNLTRGYTLLRNERGELYSVGRVQTPTLAMLVERELAIRDFVPENYCEVSVRFAVQGQEASFEGTYFDPELERRLRAEGHADAQARASRLPADGQLADRIAGRAAGQPAVVEQVNARQHRIPPPLLYDLTELQRDANRLYGYSAKTTLEIAQRLYEQHKLLTYPRSASRHLTRSVATTLPQVVQAIAAPYRDRLAPGTGVRALGARFVDDAKVSDHHAIIPTATSAAGLPLSAQEQRIYDLVCRRLLSAWHEDHLYSSTSVISRVDHAYGSDRYRSHGTRVDRPGFRVLDPPSARGRVVDAEAVLPPGLAVRDTLRVLSARKLEKQTRPPPRLTDAALLTAMQTAGRTLDDRELADAMKESGLGTPATRAAILETLLDRGYVQRERKALLPTPKGIALIQNVHPDVKSPSLTARWETELKRIEQGEAALGGFVANIEEHVRSIVAQLRSPGSTPPPPEFRARRSAGEAASTERSASAEETHTVRSGRASRPDIAERDLTPGGHPAHVAAGQQAQPSPVSGRARSRTTRTRGRKARASEAHSARAAASATPAPARAQRAKRAAPGQARGARATRRPAPTHALERTDLAELSRTRPGEVSATGLPHDRAPATSRSTQAPSGEARATAQPRHRAPATSRSTQAPSGETQAARQTNDGVAAAASWTRGAAGEWLVRAAPGLSGQWVQVRRRDGTSTRVELTAAVGARGTSALYAIGRQEANAKSRTSRKRRPRRGTP